MYLQESPQTPEPDDEVCTDGYCSTCGAIALMGANYCENHIPPPPAAPVSSDARPASSGPSVYLTLSQWEQMMLIMIRSEFGTMGRDHVARAFDALLSGGAPHGK